MDRASLMKQSAIRHFKIVRNLTDKVPAYNKLANDSHGFKMHSMLAHQENKILNSISVYAEYGELIKELANILEGPIDG